MEKEFRREQHYAISLDGKLVHITDAHKDSEDYYCPHCGCRMLKKCGHIRTWHFAHDCRSATEQQKNCSYETYLHGYAKYRLKQWFDESMSITLHLKQSKICNNSHNCQLAQKENCRLETKTSYNIKDYFQKCTVESTINLANVNYRADLLLTSETNSRNQILIEIKVSHACTDKKKTSGARIIEFEITSEEDVDYIISHDITESDKVRYYGFRLDKFDKKDEVPRQKFKKFILYKSGKTKCVDIDCQSILNRKKSSIFELTTVSEVEFWVLNLTGLFAARESGLEFKNCYLCQHNCYNDQNKQFMCEIDDEIDYRIKKGAYALNCDKYQFTTRENEKIKQSQIGIIDIWSRSSH